MPLRGAYCTAASPCDYRLVSSYRMALPLSFAYDAVFLARCFDKKLPTGHPTDQMMILCRPLGQGSFALQILREAVARGSFAEYDSGVFLTARAATPIALASEAASLVAWGFGMF